MVDAAMLAGHIAAPTGARTVQHHGDVPDAGERSQAGAGIATVATGLVVADRHARLDMVGGETDAAIPDSMIDHDPAGSREHPKPAVLPNAVRSGFRHRVGDPAAH